MFDEKYVAYEILYLGRDFLSCLVKREAGDTVVAECRDGRCDAWQGRCRVAGVRLTTIVSVEEERG